MPGAYCVSNKLCEVLALYADVVGTIFPNM